MEGSKATTAQDRAGTAARHAPLLPPATPRGSGGAWQEVLSALRSVLHFRVALVVRRGDEAGDPAGGIHAAEPAETDVADLRAVLALQPGWRIALGGRSAVRDGDAGAAMACERRAAEGPAHVMDLLLPAVAVANGADGGDPTHGPAHGTAGASGRIRLLREPWHAFTAAEAAEVARLSPLLLPLLARGATDAPDAVAWRERRLGQALLAVLDQLGLGVCLLDSGMRALLASARALGSGAVRLQGGRLAATDRAADRELREAVTAVLAQPDAAAQGLCLGRRNAGHGGATRHRALHGLVTTIRDPAAGEDGAGQARLAVLLVLPDAAPRHPERVIQTMFGLSPVEARIAKLLSDGLTPVEAATRLRMRPNTLRGYMKSIFIKLDVHRQSELVQLMSTRAGLLRGNGGGADTTPAAA